MKARIDRHAPVPTAPDCLVPRSTLIRDGTPTSYLFPATLRSGCRLLQFWPPQLGLGWNSSLLWVTQVVGFLLISEKGFWGRDPFSPKARGFYDKFVLFLLIVTLLSPPSFGRYSSTGLP